MPESHMSVAMVCSGATATEALSPDSRRGRYGLTARRKSANGLAAPLVAWGRPGQVILGDAMAMDSVRLVLVNWPSQSTNEASRYEASSLK